MTDTTAKSLVRTYIEQVWNNASLDLLSSLVTDDFKYSIGSQPPRDQGAMKLFLQMVHSAFPDWHVVIESPTEEDSLVCVRWSGTATHKGVFHGIPPTGKSVSVSGINIYELRHDKIAQEWEQMDSLGLLHQLGVLPSP